MRIGPGVLSPGAYGAARAPGGVLAPVAGATVERSVHGGDLSGALSSGLRRTVRAVARALVTLLRAGGPALAALLAALRARTRSPHLVADAATARGLRLVDPPRSAPRVPAPRPPQEDAVRRLELTLPADPTAPGRARGLLQEAVRAWGVDDEVHQDAAMVVTELVANAVDHARTPSTLTLELDGDALRIAVRDTSPAAALRARPVDPTAPRGRGLQMIEALTRSWGVDCDTAGKTVWAVLDGYSGSR